MRLMMKMLLCTRFPRKKMKRAQPLDPLLPFYYMGAAQSGAETTFLHINSPFAGSVIVDGESEIFSSSGDSPQAQMWCYKDLEFGLLAEGKIYMEDGELELFDGGEISMLWDDCVGSFNPERSAVSSPYSIVNARDCSVESTSPVRSSVTCLKDDMDIDDQLSLLHLLKAHAEATDREQTELSEVIQRCISEKVNPFGETVERFSFYFFRSNDQQYANLRQESQKNFEPAFKAFYQILPLGRFAHLASNSAILAAMPADTETLNVVDFDVGEGIQWAPVLETLGREKKALSLTCIKWEGDCPTSAPSHWNFESTQRRLICHATSVGVNLKVQEVEMGDLVSEIAKSAGRRDWLAFNCQVGLPHMARARNHERVTEFLIIAKHVTADSTTGGGGIITLGEGEVFKRRTKDSDYSTFFMERLAHSQALLQALEWSFPDQLAEAKMTMECLFMSPNISSPEWLQQWKYVKQQGDDQADIGLEGLKLSQSSLLEAKGLIAPGEHSFGVRKGGKNENEIVLEWGGTPLVRVSTWI
uniref:Nodulation signaling pathway 2-like protein n=2 Tax=Kalanchoe fedtschenkoi TaxID=63787 RepID=A0A7N0TVX4_KALFE